jgi:hypothetical protein
LDIQWCMLTGPSWLHETTLIDETCPLLTGVYLVKRLDPLAI